MALLDIFASNLTGAPAPKPQNEAERKLIQERAKKPLPMGKGRTGIEVARELGQRLNLDPNMILGSAMGEGLGLMYDPNRASDHSDAYAYNTLAGNVDPNKYPVDAFYFGGLDNFGPVAKQLKSKGYVRKDMDFAIMPVMNEAVERQYLFQPKRKPNGQVERDAKGNPVVARYIAPKEMVDKYLNTNSMDDKEYVAFISDVQKYVKSKGGVLNESVAFQNTDDMLEAKAAYLRLFKDQAESYAKKKGVKIPDEDMNYVIMSAYNGGAGAAYDLIDMMAQGAKGVSKTGGKRKEVHANLQPRMRYTSYLTELPANVFPQQGSLQTAVGQGTPNKQ